MSSNLLIRKTPSPHAFSSEFWQISSTQRRICALIWKQNYQLVSLQGKVQSLLQVVQQRVDTICLRWCRRGRSIRQATGFKFSGPSNSDGLVLRVYVIKTLHITVASSYSNRMVLHLFFFLPLPSDFQNNFRKHNLSSGVKTAGCSDFPFSLVIQQVCQN